MKAHVATDGEACEPTTIKGLTEEDWEVLHDLGVELTELDIVSGMSLDTAVFAIQQIELHLGTLEVKAGEELGLNEVLRVISRIRILVTSTLISLGVLGDLQTGEDGKPVPVELPSLGIAEGETLADATARVLMRTDERESGGG